MKPIFGVSLPALWDGKANPDEGDITTCPKCLNASMEYVTIGTPEGSFWSCECGMEIYEWRRNKHGHVEIVRSN